MVPTPVVYILLFCLNLGLKVGAWNTLPTCQTSVTHGARDAHGMEVPVTETAVGTSSRKDFLRFLGGGLSSVIVFSTLPAQAYTPDSDKLRESLYLISRVQEATVQQERFVSKASQQEDLKAKMKLTLRLVEKNYRLLDQINYASTFVSPQSDLVVASEAGYEAVDALQGAIDFVRNDLGSGPLSDSQKNFLMTSMQSCRENIFVFLKYMPQDKLQAARKRVEEENILNREEFDGDADAGVYNPVILPWKNQ